MSISASLSMMPPPRPAAGFGRWCRLTTATPSTLTLRSRGLTSSTRPRLPRSRPAMTMTWSPFFTLARLLLLCAISNHLRRERNYLHEVAVAEFARHGAEDARADGRVVGLNQYARVLVEANVCAVLAPNLFDGANDDGVVHRPLLHRAVGRRLLDRDLDLVTQGSPRRLGRAADGLDHLDATRARVVRHVQRRLHLDCHLLTPFAVLSFEFSVFRKAAPPLAENLKLKTQNYFSAF